MSSDTSQQPRLGPAWRSASSGGRGFQPPSAASEPDPSSSGEGGLSKMSTNRNSFSLLNDDDDHGHGHGHSGPSSRSKKSNGSRSNNGNVNVNVNVNSSPKRGGFTSRSEGLRSAGLGSGGFASRSASKGGGTGRSLADLVSRFPSSDRGEGRSNSNTRSGPSTRHSARTEDSSGGVGMGMNAGVGERTSSHGAPRSSSMSNFVDDKKVIRFTRERLLSMRPRTDMDAVRPNALDALDGSALLSSEPLDPVCWDNFDAEEIWNLTKDRRAAKQSTGMPGRRDSEQGGRPGRSGSGGGHDSWKRGVALPPGGEGGRRGSRYESDDPDDLWDDPASATEADADFSAFGGSLDDAPKSAGDAFDLAKMAEMTKQIDDEVRGDASSAGEEDNNLDHAVNPTRPLASAGTTIRSGSGDNVNVFEDFAAPAANAPAEQIQEPIRSGDDAQSASSRLMQMIGVSSGDGNNANGDVANPTATDGAQDAAGPDIFSAFGAPSSSVPSNPWGAPAPMAEPAAEPTSNGGLDLSAKMREAKQAKDQSAEIEMMRKQKEEEEQRRLALVAQQQAEVQARQAAMQKQQQQQAAAAAAAQSQGQSQVPQPEYSQVELVLTERISTILENSWGRSDLMTVLQTLHTDDARVVPLLGTVDALRALIVRHPRRFALTKDPTFGAEMAVLIMNNSQWQQHQASEELQRRQQDDHQKMLAAKKAEAEARASETIVITNDPWYYADPQGNIQGPFGGDEMRQWLAAGYFKGDLPISQNQNGGFRPLSTLFSDVSNAFKPSGPSEDEAAKIAAEMEARAAAEAAARADEEAREKAEREAMVARAAAEAEAERLAEMQNNQNQSAQLKMLLGLGSGGSSQVAGVEQVPNTPDESDETEKQSIPKISEEIEEPAPQSRPAKSKAKKNPAPKVEQQPEPEPAPAPVTVSAPAAPPAWGGAGASKPQAKNKSMSEIQKEEARVSAQTVKQRKKTQPSGGGWAGIAASGGSTAWSGQTVKNAPAANTSSSLSGGKSARGSQQMAKVSSQGQGANSRSSTQQTLEDFGANDKMTPALENWCKEQMRKLNGSEDLTLVAFCMTLTDPVEIKQYLTAYLGSTSQVNNFASEFINRKNGTKQQEQWETTSSSKKGRKKKGIA